MARTLKYAFRITHIQNVPHVLRCGLVRAGSPQSDPSYVPIGDRQVIRLREERTLAGHKISDYVPFYLGPRSPMLYVIQHGYNGVTRVDPEQIINFPTKTDWRRPSEYSYIEQGLQALRTEIISRHITSVAIPPLGSHNGGLDWPTCSTTSTAATSRVWAVWTPVRSITSGCWMIPRQRPGAILTRVAMPACAQPIKAKLESFMVDDMKYCGLLNETDLTQVQQRIIASGTLTVDEMNTFFLKKN